MQYSLSSSQIYHSESSQKSVKTQLIHPPAEVLRPVLLQCQLPSLRISWVEISEFSSQVFHLTFSPQAQKRYWQYLLFAYEIQLLSAPQTFSDFQTG